MNYYFAYGSNMNQQQMQERCPESLLIGKARLSHYKLDFTIYSEKRKCGCADIVLTKDGEVWGLLYIVSDSDLEALDTFEGHPIHYKRCCVTVYDNCGVGYTVFTYEVVTKHTSTLKTSKQYLGLLQEAAVHHDFPKGYTEFLGSFTTIE